MSVVESLDKEGRLSTSTLRTPLTGDPVLMVLTVSDPSVPGDAGWSGRVIIPQIGQMDEVGLPSMGRILKFRKTVGRRITFRLWRTFTACGSSIICIHAGVRDARIGIGLVWS